MPRLTIPSILSQCETWVASNPCPKNADGEPRIAHWVYRAACAFRLRRLSTESAHSLIERSMNRQPRPREIEQAIAKAYSQPMTNGRDKKQPDEPKPQYNPAKLERIANRIDFDITPEWLQERSAVTIRDLTPAGFLHALYEPGERVWIGTFQNDRRGELYIHRGGDENLACLDHLREGHEGVWFLSNPVTAEAVEGAGTVNEFYPKGESWRSEENVTSWRYMVIESDEEPESLWLRMLVQAPLAISAIYTSGSRSIHALVRVDKRSKEEWDQFKDSIKNELITIGADPNSLSAVRLTRLPGCIRNEPGKTGLQRFLYLNSQPTNTPIFKLDPRSK